MKFITIALGALPLLQFAAAQPHYRNRHAHQEHHEKKDLENQHEKKDLKMFTVIETVYAQKTPEVIVFVNQFGDPLSTITEDSPDSPPKTLSMAHGVVPSASPSTSVAAPAPAPTSHLVEPAPVVASSAPAVETAVKVAPVVNNVAADSSAQVASSPAPAETKATSSSSSGSTSSEGGGFGFAYSPYMADNSCKDQAQVNADFAKIGKGYSLVRTYGTDCNQTAMVLTAIKAYGMKLFAGIFSLNSLSDDVAILSAAAGGDWSSVDTISVGNELVNSGSASPSAVVAALTKVRGLLKAANYPGKVVTVDTLVAARANPTLCDNSDYCAVNCHPFFDGNVAAKESGDFLSTQIATLQNVLVNKNQKIVITETGWPWQGNTNGAAVPSVSNQDDAIGSIKSTFSSNPSGVILFSTFNNLWKTNTASQFQAEKYWGFLGDAPSG